MRFYLKNSRSGKKIPEINRRRAIRALELAKFGQNLENKETNYEALLIGLNDDRQVLYDRINHRVDLMLERVFWMKPNGFMIITVMFKQRERLVIKSFFHILQATLLWKTVSKTQAEHTPFRQAPIDVVQKSHGCQFYTVSEVDFKETVIQEVNKF